MRLDPSLLLAGITVGQAHLRLGDVEAAGKIYERLLRLSERKDVWDLRPNQLHWFTIIGDRTISMNNQPMKLSYLRYHAALCRHLQGREEDAAAEAKRAADLDPRDRAQIQVLIRREIEKIAARQVGSLAKLGRFRAGYLEE
jgi:tetratricopeptide (TPR) repeat protein